MFPFVNRRPRLKKTYFYPFVSLDTSYPHHYTPFYRCCPMEAVNAQSLWKKALGEIETEISRANFLTLFKNTVLLSFENDVATIATPSTMIIDLLQKRFYQLIKKTLDKHTGKNINIVFVPKLIAEPSSKTKDGPLFAQAPQETEKKTDNTMQRQLSRVRPDFTFQTMAVSSSNQLAFVSAQTVAKNLGKSYNPLFIYGPVGVGKTHLMQAIANEVHAGSSNKKVIYITSEEFTNEVVEAIRTNDTARMKKRFRSADLLIIDDVQFIAGKDRVQEELFHTFNILIDNASQVVLSSDRPPSEIQKLEKRLSSRFASGLAVDIESPDFELRTAILLIKAKKYNVDLSMESAKLIAQNQVDVRMLEGSLLRVITEAAARRSDLSEDVVSGILSLGGEKQPTRLHSEDIINIVCSFYNIKSTLLKGPKRDASLVRARQVAMYLLKKELRLTFVDIGNILGGRDHTTIMHGVEKIETILTSSEKHPVSMDIVGITRVLSEQYVDYR